MQTCIISYAFIIEFREHLCKNKPDPLSQFLEVVFIEFSEYIFTIFMT